VSLLSEEIIKSHRIALMFQMCIRHAVLNTYKRLEIKDFETVLGYRHAYNDWPNPCPSSHSSVTTKCIGQQGTLHGYAATHEPIVGFLFGLDRAFLPIELFLPSALHIGKLNAAGAPH
jgi:hypothetical protein